MEEVNLNQVNRYAEKAMDMAVEYGPKLLLAILTLIIDLWIIKLARQ